MVVVDFDINREQEPENEQNQEKKGEVFDVDSTPSPDLQIVERTPEITPAKIRQEREIIRRILENPETNPWNPFKQERGQA